MRWAVRLRSRLREFAGRVLRVGRSAPAALFLCGFLAACAAPPEYYPAPPGIDNFSNDVASTELAAITGSTSDPPGDELKPIEAETAAKFGLPQVADAGSNSPEPTQWGPQIALLPPPTQIVEGPAPEGAAGAVIPGALRPVIRPGEELLIIELRLRNYVLGEAIEAYQNGGGLLLPLGDYARALDFPITVDPEAGSADGWFLRENRIFSLNLARGEVIVDGERRPVTPGMVELHESDIFVDTRELAKWFPVEIEFNLSRLNAKVASREPLPIERRLERERLRTRLMGRGAVAQSEYPGYESPYGLASWPFLDATVEASHHENASGVSASQLTYGTLFTGDLLYMNSRIYLAGSDSDPLSQARLELGRRDPDNTLLGPLQASEFAMGDIANPSDGLVAVSVHGRGARISNFPLNRAAEFDRTTVRGELPPGWEAELYRNNALLQIQSSRPDGRYEFADVPLVYGLNVLRITLHGPQGQKRVDNRRIMVGPGMVRPGEFNYHLSASQHGASLLPVDNDVITNPTDDPRDGEGRMVSQFEVGLGRHLSLAAGASTLPLKTGQRNYGTFGIRAIAGDTFGRLDVVTDNEGGRGGTLALQRRLTDDFSVSLEHGIFENFVSEQIVGNGGMLESRSRARLDGLAMLPHLPRLALGLSAEHDRTDIGREQTAVAQRMSSAIGGISVSNNHRAQFIRGLGQNATTVDGSFLVGGSIRRIYLRGQLGYGLYPERSFDSASVSGTWRIDPDFTGSASVNHLIDTRHTGLTAGVSRRIGVASLGLSGDYASDGSYGARLVFSVGIGREPRSGAYMVQSRAMAEKGAISARAFLDRNNNGRFDDGDEPLKGVRFRSNNVTVQAETDDNGIAFLTELAPNRRTNIVLAQASIEDPYWIPTNAGVSLVPRPGVAGIVEFPVVATAEVDGTIYERVGDQRLEVSNVKVQLIDEQGRVAKEVRSAFDGFYLFEQVIPGRYRVRVDPEQMARLNLEAPGELQIALAPEQVINGENIRIGRLTALAGNAPAAAPAPKAAPEVPAQLAEELPATREAPETAPETAQSAEAPAPVPAPEIPVVTPPADLVPVPPPETVTEDAVPPPPAQPRTDPPQIAESPQPIPPAATDTPAPPPTQTAEAPPPTETQQAVQTAARAMACPVVKFVVKPGESLWRIARRIYGSGGKYAVLYTANGARIRDPNLIYPGQELTIPWREGMNAEVAARLGLTEAVQNSALAQAGKCGTHRIVVRKGDSLWRIARRTYGRGTLNMHLFQANRGKIKIPDLIHPGQEIFLPRFGVAGAAAPLPPPPVVPAAPRRAAPRNSAPPTVLAQGARSIVVQPGDSLWRIARRAYGSGSLNMQLFRRNHMQIPVPDRIYPGQVVVLPSPEELLRRDGSARR